MGDTEIIPLDARYSLMIVMAYLTEKRAGPGGEHYPQCSVDMLAQSGWMHDNDVSRDETARILLEVEALGHATRDTEGCYTITQAGIDWIEVEALIRRSAVTTPRPPRGGEVMQTIHKCRVRIHGVTQLPEGAQVLSVGLQDGDLRCWYITSVGNHPLVDALRVYGTGRMISDTPGRFVGTVQQESFVWHVFDIREA